METLVEQNSNIVYDIPRDITKKTINSPVSETNEEDNSEKLKIPLFGAKVGHLKKKLLVLDINGLLVDLVYPPPEDHKADAIITECGMFMRPFSLEFLEFCFENFEVAIWSTRSKECVEHFVDLLKGQIKTKFLFYWDETHCTKTSFNTFEDKYRLLQLKDLRKIWDKQHPNLPWEKGYYNETNTLLLDDSPCKALLNPPHTSVFPRTFTYQNKSDKSLGVGGELREYIKGLANANNMAKYVEENPFGKEAITKKSQSWNYYHHVLATISMIQSQDNASANIYE